MTYRLRMAAVVILLGWGCTAGAASFGNADDRRFARKLWSALVEAELVGPGRRALKPFFAGADPHGRVLELARGRLEVNGRRGRFRLKRSHDREGARVERVRSHPERYLSFYTVMFRRADGYAPETDNWFWVKYLPDGRLARKKNGGKTLPVAGRVAREADGGYGGCLYCHRSAGGGDYTFYPLRRFEVFGVAEDTKEIP